MFKYIILCAFVINFKVFSNPTKADYENDKAFCKSRIKHAIALGKKLKEDSKALEGKSENFLKDSCQGSVYEYIAPRVQENLEERRKIKALLEDYKKQDKETKLKLLKKLVVRSDQYVEGVTSLRPDLDYLKTVSFEN